MLSALKSPYERAKIFYQRHEKILVPASLIFGFTADYLTFSNIQINIALAVLFFHFLLAGATIAFIQYYDVGLVSKRFASLRLFAPLIIQFTFGALLGASFIFYWFSGSFSVSWPLITIIAILMISNEFLRRYFLNPSLQIAVYFFIAFSLFSIALPFLFNSISPLLFLVAGIGSIILIYIYLRLLTHISAARGRKRLTSAVIALIFLGMNVLYFSDFIPPIPLSLREAGAYHLIERINGSYTLRGEPENLWQRFVPGQTVHLAPWEHIYVYTAIFAPADLKAKIYHRWMYKKDGVWIETDRIAFPVTGGRKEGYRGYSLKNNSFPGSWRVSVETERGQALGRINFNIEAVTEVPELKEGRR